MVCKNYTVIMTDLWKYILFLKYYVKHYTCHVIHSIELPQATQLLVKLKCLCKRPVPRACVPMSSSTLPLQVPTHSGYVLKEEQLHRELRTGSGQHYCDSSQHYTYNSDHNFTKGKEQFELLLL